MRLALAAVMLCFGSDAVRFELVHSVFLPYGKIQEIHRSGKLTYVAAGVGGLYILEGGQVIGRYITGSNAHEYMGRTWIADKRGEAKAVRVSGTTAYVLTVSKGYDTFRGKIIQLDVSDPKKPRWTGEYVLEREANHLAVNGSLVYAALKGPEPLVVVDFSDPGRAREVGALRLGKKERLEFQKLAFHEKELVAIGDSAVHFIDPHKPTIVSAKKMNAVDLEVSNGRFIIGDDQGRWSSIDGENVSSPERPDLKAVCEGEAGALRRDGKKLYVGNRVFDLSDPDRPVLLQESSPVETPTPSYVCAGRAGLQIAGGGQFYDHAAGRMSAADVKVVGTTAYLADWDNGLYVLDVSDPASPKMLARFNTGNAHGVEVVDSTAYVADGGYGLKAIDVSDPRNPRGKGRYQAPGVFFKSILAYADRLYVSEAGFLRVFKVQSDPNGVSWRSMELAGHVKIPMGIPDVLRISPNGKFAYMANDEGWNMVTLDIQDPKKPFMRSVMATSGFCHGLALSGPHVLATNNSDSLWVFDVTDPDRPKIVSTFSMGGKAGKVDACGNLAAVAGPQGVSLIDLSDPKKPKAIGSLPGFRNFRLTEKLFVGVAKESLSVWDVSSQRQLAALLGDFSDVELRGQLLYVGAGSKFQILDLNLAVKGEVALYEEAPKKKGQKTKVKRVPSGKVSVDGQFAYVGGEHLRIIDVSDPAKPRIVSEVVAPDHEGTYGSGQCSFGDLRPRGNLLYSVHGHWGLFVFDVTDKANPKKIGDFATQGGDWTGITVSGGRAYVGNNWGGIYIADVTDPSKPNLLGGTRKITERNGGGAGPIVVGSTLYFQGNTDRTLRVADVSDPEAPKLVKELKFDGSEKGDTRMFGFLFGTVRGKYYYAPGFARIYDLSTLQMVGECKEAGFQNHSTCLVGDRLYLTSTEGLKIVDVSNPAKPALLGICPGDQQGGFYFGRGIQADERYVYVCNRHQFNIIDCQDPTKPRLISTLEVTGFTCDVAVRDGKAYILGYYGGLHVADVSNPTRPTLVDFFQQGVYYDRGPWDNVACYQSIDIVGDYAYVTEYYSGLHVIRIR